MYVSDINNISDFSNVKQYDNNSYDNCNVIPYDNDSIFPEVYNVSEVNTNNIVYEHDPYQSSDQIPGQIQPRPYPPPPSYNTPSFNNHSFNDSSKARAPNQTSKKIQIFEISSTALSDTKFPEGVIVDSGSSTHVFKRPSYFVNWDHNFNIANCIIKLAAGKATNVVRGRGTVELRLLNNHNQTTIIRLLNALYIPSLNHEGIISTKQ